MKVIDEKGRLFGRLNIVDLLVLVIIIAAAVVLGMKFLGGSRGGEDGPVSLVYTARVMEVTQESYDSVRQYVDKAAGKKDQLQASGKLLDGYIVDVSATPHIASPGDTVGGETLDLLFTIEANAADPVTNAVGTQEIRVGKPHVVKSQHIEFEDAQIMTCKWLGA